MKLAPENIKLVLNELDQALAKLDESRTLVVCGGGALLVIDVIDRLTRDIDVISPELDSLVINLASEIGKKHSLENGWLNNGPASLAKDLKPGWRDRTEVIFKGKALTLEGLGRLDFLASKLFAYCDRDEHDLDDILLMKPAWNEIEEIKGWLLYRDASELWPKRVETQLLLLKRKLGHD